MSTKKIIVPIPTVNISQLARDHRTSRETIRKLRADGIDLLNTAALTAGLADTRAKGTSPPLAHLGESIQDARRRKIIAEADRAEIIAKREAGAVVAVSDVEVMMNVLGAELRAKLLSMRSDLVIELEGLQGSQIYVALDRRITELLTSINMKSIL